MIAMRAFWADVIGEPLAELASPHTWAELIALAVFGLGLGFVGAGLAWRALI